MAADRASRVCFVIMPFSKTRMCTEAEWTQVFEDVIKPAVEGDPDLGFVCRRSVATRGSLIRGIMEDLDSAYVVIADLTDRNPNVFYELGVRHTLEDRTIIISQNRRHIPFDLQSYANHVYKWRTEQEKAAFAHGLRELLREVDQKPYRPDSPVTDFLRRSRRGQRASADDSRLDRVEQQLEDLERRFELLSSGSGRATRGLDAWVDSHSALDQLPDNVTFHDLVGRLATSDE